MSLEEAQPQQGIFPFFCTDSHARVTSGLRIAFSDEVQKETELYKGGGEQPVHQQRKSQAQCDLEAWVTTHMQLPKGAVGAAAAPTTPTLNQPPPPPAAAAAAAADSQESASDDNNQPPSKKMRFSAAVSANSNSNSDSNSDSNNGENCDSGAHGSEGELVTPDFLQPAAPTGLELLQSVVFAEATPGVLNVTDVLLTFDDGKTAELIKKLDKTNMKVLFASICANETETLATEKYRKLADIHGLPLLVSRFFLCFFKFILMNILMFF